MDEHPVLEGGGAQAQVHRRVPGLKGVAHHRQLQGRRGLAPLRGREGVGVGEAELGPRQDPGLAARGVDQGPAHHPPPPMDQEQGAPARDQAHQLRLRLEVCPGAEAAHRLGHVELPVEAVEVRRVPGHRDRAVLPVEAAEARAQLAAAHLVEPGVHRAAQGEAGAEVRGHHQVPVEAGGQARDQVHQAHRGQRRLGHRLGPPGEEPREAAVEAHRHLGWRVGEEGDQGLLEVALPPQDVDGQRIPTARPTGGHGVDPPMPGDQISPERGPLADCPSEAQGPILKVRCHPPAGRRVAETPRVEE